MKPPPGDPLFRGQAAQPYIRQLRTPPSSFHMAPLQAASTGLCPRPPALPPTPVWFNILGVGPCGRQLQGFILWGGGVGGCFSNYYLFSPCAAINNRPRPNILFPLTLQTFLPSRRPMATGGTQPRALPLHRGGVVPGPPNPAGAQGEVAAPAGLCPPCPLHGVEKEVIFFFLITKYLLLLKGSGPQDSGGSAGTPKKQGEKLISWGHRV